MYIIVTVNLECTHLTYSILSLAPYHWITYSPNCYQKILRYLERFQNADNLLDCTELMATRPRTSDFQSLSISRELKPLHCRVQQRLPNHR